MSAKNILLAGFGGQGILFAGKFLVYAGMLEGREVSWLPSYGPEMRGGTANCGVILSDEPVGSPIVTSPDVLIALNLPSFDTFEKACAPGAFVFADSTLIQREAARTDIAAFYIPATRMAEEAGLKGLANMIITGKAIKETGLIARDTVRAAMGKVISEKKMKLFDLNLRAIELGFGFE
ncbi:MAG: 2-oxoacid:acceptor oxidoreductase family protein [Clostridiales bacterium]|nr:2-oxoacid:acceptor oxidoreductase family protein [Clostridiales bacterium]